MNGTDVENPNVAANQSGYLIGERGYPVAAGVVCKCPADFCPAHGRLDKTELKLGRRVRKAPTL